MSKFPYIIFIGFMLAVSLYSSGYADTQVSGNVSGRWTLDESPFVATDNLTVTDGSTLRIDAGVQVLFEGNFKFFVYGKLIAFGTENDSIKFDVIPGGELWGGIRMLDADTVRMDYCVVVNGRATGGESALDTLGAGGNIFISGGNVIIDHSRLSYGFAHGNGGGIAIWNSSAIIRNSLINENESANFGGGVSICTASSPTFRNVRISDNTSVSNGGGVLIIIESDPLFESCIIQNNSCTNGDNGNGGGAFVTEASSPRFHQCEFLENNGSAGGGVYVRGEGTDPIFEWCYFWGNSTNVGSRVGGAVYIRGGAAAEIAYSRFVENNANQGGGIYIKEPPRATVDHCLFLRNAATRAGGAIGASTDLGETPFTLNNCTFIDNRNIGGEPIAHTAYARRPEGVAGSLILLNSCIIFGPTPLFAEENRVLVRYSNILNGYPGEGNVANDPGFFASDSVWFVLSGTSNCIDSGDTTLVRDPDGSFPDRGWLYFPHDAWDNISEEPLAVHQTTDDRTTVDFTFRNETGVPIYVTPMDRWNEGGREMLVDISAITNDNEIQAVATTQAGYFIAGGNNGEDPNYIYSLDDSLNLRGRFEQPGGSNEVGYTDLASDGNSILYGCYEDFIIEFSIDGEFGQDYRSPEEITRCTGLAADFNNPDDFVDFYLGGDEGVIIRTDAGMFPINSTIVGDSIVALGSKGNTRAVYAMTPINATLSMLWLITPDDQKATPLYPIVAPDGYRMGGFEVTQNYREGRGSIVGIMRGEGDTPDRLYALDLYTSWLAIKPNLRLLMPGEEIAWPIEFVGNQMPPGLYDADFFLAVNGYGQGGEVGAQMLTDPGRVLNNGNPTPVQETLGAPWPNPFNSTVRVRFNLNSPSKVSISVFDLNGRIVGVISESEFAAGSHDAVFDAGSIPAGQYYVSLTLPDRTLVKPITLVR